MKKMYILFILLFAISQVVLGQVDFDTNADWTAGSGSLNSYQSDHQYDGTVSGVTINFTGGPALRESSGTQDGFSKTHSGTYSWRLRNNSSVSWIATVSTTEINGFSFFVRRWDGSPAANFDVAYSTDGGTVYTSVGTIDNTLLSDSDWKLFSYGTTINAAANIKIRVKANGTTERIFIDDFSVTLPVQVELTSFTAKATETAVVLNWTTATEVNNYGFDVESKRASTDAWETIAFVEGHGNSNSPKEYSYVVANATSGSYRLKQIDTDGGFEYSDVVTVGNVVNKLSQNYPNPFNPTTQISFSVAQASNVNISVYNAFGQKVTELVNKNMNAGNHAVNFNGSNLASGFYFYRIETPNYTKTMKMMLLK